MHRSPLLSRLPLVAASAVLLSACSDATPTAPAARPAAATAVAPSRTQLTTGPQECRPDSRFIGRIELATRDEPGTWWHLTRSGFDAAGITDYLGTISDAFGIPFTDLPAAVTYLVDAIRPLDENQNGYVCAYSGRGTLGWSGDPNFWLYHFGVRDDKHGGA